MATGVPVANLTGPYAQETSILGSALLQYVEMDVYDPARVQLVKTLKKEGQEWVSKYARGGSARTASARKFYVAIDSVQGHLASNGYAPYPKSKIGKLIKDVEEANTLMAEGR